jgi:hypothetical protein
LAGVTDCGPFLASTVDGSAKNKKKLSLFDAWLGDLDALIRPGVACAEVSDADRS